MSDKPPDTGMVKVGYKSPPVEHRFGKGNKLGAKGRTPKSASGVPAPLRKENGDLVTAQDLATPHVQEAINVLLDLFTSPNHVVRRAAARDIIELAEPDLNDAKIQKAVDEKLQKLFEEAQKARADEKRGIEVKP